ncbi:13688_t:CDS:1, partial [Cetraspora pellucida]
LAFNSIDALTLTDPILQALKYIIGLLKHNSRDLIQKLHRLICDILSFMAKYELIMDNTLYVELRRASNEVQLTDGERNELHAALSKHVTNEHLCIHKRSIKSILNGSEKHKSCTNVYKKVRFE